METTAKHTPGPWTIWHRGKHAPIVNSIDEQICTCSLTATRVGGIASVEHVEANAHLIAAAPEMWEVCRALLHWADDFSHCSVPWPGTLNEAVSAARAAIAKATGNE